MKDPWFGHRSFPDFQPYGDKDEWTDWDYALASALQVLEDMTDQNGLLLWETEPDRMEVVALKKFDKFQRAVDSITSKKNYKAQPGERFVPDLVLRGGEWPTYQAWLAEKRKEYAESEDGTID